MMVCTCTYMYMCMYMYIHVHVHVHVHVKVSHSFYVLLQYCIIPCRVFKSSVVHSQGVQYFLLDVSFKVHLSLAVVLY